MATVWPGDAVDQVDVERREARPRIAVQRPRRPRHARCGRPGCARLGVEEALHADADPVARRGRASTASRSGVAVSGDVSTASGDAAGPPRLRSATSNSSTQLVRASR